MILKYYNNIAKYIKYNLLKITWNNILKKIKIKMLKNLNYFKLQIYFNNQYKYQNIINKIIIILQILIYKIFYLIN